MRHYETMIREYTAQAICIQERIARLNAEIAGALRAREDGRAKLLSSRRFVLYHELWEMEESVRKMKEYLQCVGERRA